MGDGGGGSGVSDDACFTQRVLEMLESGVLWSRCYNISFHDTLHTFVFLKSRECVRLGETPGSRPGRYGCQRSRAVDRSPRAEVVEARVAVCSPPRTPGADSFHILRRKRQAAVTLDYESLTKKPPQARSARGVFSFLLCTCVRFGLYTAIE